MFFAAHLLTRIVSLSESFCRHRDRTSVPSFAVREAQPSLSAPVLARMALVLTTLPLYYVFDKTVLAENIPSISISGTKNHEDPSADLYTSTYILAALFVMKPSFNSAA